MSVARKGELIERVRRQVSELSRRKISQGIVLRVILASRKGMRCVRGCLTANEVKHPSKKGGFRNGTLVLRPTIPALDHKRSALPRIKNRISQIVDIVVES